MSTYKTMIAKLDSLYNTVAVFEDKTAKGIKVLRMVGMDTKTFSVRQAKQLGFDRLAQEAQEIK